MSESLEPAAHARIDAVRAGLEHDAPDEVRVDAARRLDLTPGRLLDLGDDRLRLLVRQLARRRKLDRQAALLARHQPLEFVRDLLELARATFLGRQEEEVLEQRLVFAGEFG